MFHSAEVIRLGSSYIYSAFEMEDELVSSENVLQPADDI